MDRWLIHPAPQASLRFSLRLLGCLAALTWSAAAYAQLPVTELKTIFPPGGKQGTAFDVQTSGAELDGPQSLLFSHPGITAAPNLEPAGPLVKNPRPLENQFAVTIASDTPPGIYEVRAVGRFGASNPRAFVVGSLDDVRDNGNNRAPASAQEIPVGVVVSGTAEGESIDYYKLNLKQGQRVIVDCWGRRIDSRIDSTLVLFDDKGKELARDRDTEGRDALLDFTAPADGAYLVGVYDFLYRGGAEYFYRLRAHSGPHVDAIFPPAALPGQATKLTIYGRNLPGGQPAGDMRLDDRPLEKLEVEVTLPADEQARQQAAIAVRATPKMGVIDAYAWQFTSPQGVADPVAIAYAAAPVTVEQEPNNQAAQANKVAAPCEFVGRFYPDEDPDWVQFDAKKGEVYWIEVIANRLGLESDPFLVVQKVAKNDKGEEQVQELAQVDDSGERNNRIGTDFDTTSDDPAWRLQAEDATYRVLVRDQFGSGRADPRFVYRLAIRREQPDFRLLVMPESSPAKNDNAIPQYASVLRRGGVSFVQVRVERLDGFGGEIELTAEGLPPGVTCSGAVVGGQTKDAVLMFTAEENAPAWTGPVKIAGKAKVGEQDVVRYGRPGALVWGTGNRQQEPPTARLARDLVLSVIEKETAPALVKIGDGSVVETSKGAKVEIPVSGLWRGEFKGELALSPVGAPNEFQVKNFNLKPDQKDAKLEFVLNNNNVQPGAYTFYLRGQSKFQYDRNPDAVKDYEERQKEAEAVVNETTEKAKQTAEAKTKTAQAAQEAANAVKQKEQALQAAKPEEAEKAKQELTQAQEQLKAAEAAKTQAEQEDAQAQALVQQAAERKKQIDNQVNEVKKANQKKEINLFVVSTPVKLRVNTDPIQAAVAAPPAAIKQGQKGEATFTVTRLYGFDDQVEITFEPPGGVSGLSAPKVNLEKGKAEAKLEITAADNAPVGDHTANIRFRIRFNNVQLEEVIPLPLKIEAKQ
jgi:hypothetical protein